MKSMLSVISDFYRLDSVVSFASGLGRLYWKCMKHFRTACIFTAMGRTQTHDCFSWFKHGKIVVDDCNCAGCTVTGCPRGNKNSSQNHRL